MLVKEPECVMHSGSSFYQKGFNFRFILPFLDISAVCILTLILIIFSSQLALLLGFVILIQSASTLQIRYSCIRCFSSFTVDKEKFSGKVSAI